MSQREAQKDSAKHRHRSNLIVAAPVVCPCPPLQSPVLAQFKTSAVTCCHEPAHDITRYRPNRRTISCSDSSLLTVSPSSLALLCDSGSHCSTRLCVDTHSCSRKQHDSPDQLLEPLGTHCSSGHHLQHTPLAVLQPRPDKGPSGHRTRF